jgi:hypothetical protein
VSVVSGSTYSSAYMCDAYCATTTDYHLDMQQLANVHSSDPYYYCYYIQHKLMLMMYERHVHSPVHASVRRVYMQLGLVMQCA